MKKLQQTTVKRTPVVLKCSRKTDETHINKSFISVMSERTNASKRANNTVADLATRRSRRSRMNSGRRSMRSSRRALNSSKFQQYWNRVNDPEIVDTVVLLDPNFEDVPRVYDSTLRRHFYRNNARYFQEALEDELAVMLPNHLPFSVDRDWTIVVDADLSHLYDEYEADPAFDPTTDPLYCECLDLAVALDMIARKWEQEDAEDEYVQQVLGDPDAEGLRDYWRSAL